jgi:hypothetical protein
VSVGIQEGEFLAESVVQNLHLLLQAHTRTRGVCKGGDGVSRQRRRENAGVSVGGIQKNGVGPFARECAVAPMSLSLIATRVAVVDRPIVGGKYLFQCKRFAPDNLAGAATCQQ